MTSWAYRFAEKPANMLLFFTLASCILYIDRGAIASTGVNGSLDTQVCMPLSSCALVHTTDEGTHCKKINMTSEVECKLEGSPAHGFQGDFDMSSALDGWIQSMFLVGLLVASPIFAQAAKSRDNIRLCGIGLLLWSVAVGLCGFTFDFWSLTICRTFVGVGEASLITIVPNFIDTCSPPASKAKWLAIYCIAIPTGTALGYVYGGLVAQFLHWRFAFYIEALIMLPMLLFTFMVKTSNLSYWPQHRGQNQYIETKESRWKSITSGVGVVYRDLSVLMTNPVYVLGMFGYSAYCAMMGILAYWGPKSGQAMHADVSKYGSADTIFGMVTVVSGIVGTFFGGFMLDKIGVSVSSALVFCASMTLLGSTILLAALFLSNTVEAFVLTLMVGFIIIFAIQGPINVVSMWTTPYVLRPFACAMYTVSIHVLGDVPSAPAAGFLHDRLYRKYLREGFSKAESDSKAWNLTLGISVLFGMVAVLLWLLGWVVESFVGKNRQKELRRSSSEELNVESSPLLS